MLEASRLLVFAATLLTAACVHEPHEESQTHWGYEGDRRTDPPSWGSLSSEYLTCKAGQHQSPVNVNTTNAEPAHVPALAVHYGTIPSTEVNNGHTIQDVVSRGDFIHFGETRFDLEQFHFHHPSEHTLNGSHFPLEIHFVHRSSSGLRLVMAVFITEGAEHPALHPLFDQMPHGHQAISISTDPGSLLPPDKQFVEYEGSLTTPPCNEGITWLVLTTPISASVDQIHKFATLYPHNNRPVMPLNGRHLLSGRAP
ncbi:MAG: carbonic anhydrase family protein [Polyangiaceae bacterium]|nr:carbonic anhydrase family protein [Polyangiaceae bacterium]